MAARLPAAILAQLGERGVEPEQILGAFPADLTEEGAYGERWLVVTRERVAVYAVEPAGELKTVAGLVPADLADVRLLEGAGGGWLEAQVGGEAVVLVRFTHARQAAISTARSLLDDLRKGKEPGPVKAGEGRRVCASCRRIVPDWAGVCPACVDRGKIVARLWSYARPHRAGVALVVLLMLATTGLSLLPPYLTGRVLIDEVLVPGENPGLLALVLLVLVAVRVVNGALGIWQGRVAADLSARLTYDIRSRVFEKLQELSVGFFGDQQTGVLMSRVTNDTDYLRDFLADYLGHVIGQALLFVGITAVLLWMNWQLTLVTLAPIPVLFVISRLGMRRLRRLYRWLMHEQAGLEALLNDVISGIRVVKVFGQAEKELARFDARSRGMFRAGREAEQFYASFFPLFSILTSMGTLLVWYVGGHHVLGGEISLGTLVTFIAYLAMFYEPIHMLGFIAQVFSRVFTAADRTFEILDAQPQVVDRPGALAVRRLKGAVEFAGVTFGYEAHQPVLKDVTLRVEPGEIIGIVGPSGSGKTTLINLISRLYDVDKGAVRIDGRDVREYRQDDLHRLMGVVMQETFLFNGSVAENIAYGRPEASPAEIVAAAQVANAHGFILSFEDGYDAEVGERGQRLSAGQRQRIAIARAVLRDPAILILDEATASVDTQTEREIQEALERLLAGRTTFAIAHRLSTLRNADRLVVLKEGRIVELGTHRELMASQGVYYGLVRAQRDLARVQAVGG